MPNNSFDELFPQQRRGEAARPRPTRRARAASSAAFARVEARENDPARSGCLEPMEAPADYAPYRDVNRYHRITPAPMRPVRRIAALAAGIAALLAVICGIFVFVQSLPASITLNGASLNVTGDKTLADVFRVSGIRPQPGDLVAVDGSMLQEGQGEPFHATINGKPTSDVATKLASGDIVELGAGHPIEEPADITETVQPFTFEQLGTGAIHLTEGQGTDGLKRVKVGSMSGLTVEETLQEPINAVRRNVSPDVGSDKVIALTFDDGPWQDSTEQVLDVLAEHGAKATFFTVGNRIDGPGIDLVKRAASEGHQICTHSFDHASGSGQSVNLGYMTPEEQVAEIENGYAAIRNATGTEPSHVFRAPGGNYGDEVMRNVALLVSAEIGWDIDSRDWEKPGTGAIVHQLESAWPGAIVLMHDGGGDRTQAIEALRRALPSLKSQGYRFITIDELMSYPLA